MSDEVDADFLDISLFRLITIMSPDNATDPKWPDTISKAENMEGKRILKTHLSRDIMPKALEEGKGKIVYVARNPRDVCVSFFNHWRILEVLKEIYKYTL